MLVMEIHNVSNLSHQSKILWKQKQYLVHQKITPIQRENNLAHLFLRIDSYQPSLSQPATNYGFLYLIGQQRLHSIILVCGLYKKTDM